MRAGIAADSTGSIGETVGDGSSADSTDAVLTVRVMPADITAVAADTVHHIAMMGAYHITAGAGSVDKLMNMSAVPADCSRIGMRACVTAAGAEAVGVIAVTNILNAGIADAFLAVIWVLANQSAGADALNKEVAAGNAASVTDAVPAVSGMRAAQPAASADASAVRMAYIRAAVRAVAVVIMAAVQADIYAAVAAVFRALRDRVYAVIFTHTALTFSIEIMLPGFFLITERNFVNRLAAGRTNRLLNPLAGNNVIAVVNHSCFAVIPEKTGPATRMNTACSRLSLHLRHRFFCSLIRIQMFLFRLIHRQMFFFRMYSNHAEQHGQAQQKRKQPLH